MAKQSNKVVVLTGFSGAGKDTIAAELRDRGYISAVPHTTRPMRDGEVEGNPYYYISNECFNSMIDDGDFVEHNSYKTMVGGVEDRWYYGTSIESITGTDKCVLTTGVQSSVRFKKEMNGGAILVFISVPDEMREERAASRGSFDKTEWENRLAQDKAFRGAIAIDTLADLLISNTGTVAEAADSIIKFIENQG